MNVTLQGMEEELKLLLNKHYESNGEVTEGPYHVPGNQQRKLS